MLEEIKNIMYKSIREAIEVCEDGDEDFSRQATDLARAIYEAKDFKTMKHEYHMHSWCISSTSNRTQLELGVLTYLLDGEEYFGTLAFHCFLKDFNEYDEKYGHTSRSKTPAWRLPNA